MKGITKWLLGAIGFWAQTPTWASPPKTAPKTGTDQAVQAGPPAAMRSSQEASPILSAAERWARRCQPVRAPQRHVYPQGALLWGTKRQSPKDERSSVLVSVDLGSLRLEGKDVRAVSVEAGHLEAMAVMSGAAASGTPASLAAGEFVGGVFEGRASDGPPVEVAICGVEPEAQEPERVWYRIQAWNEKAQEWENPCAATDAMPMPRALAVRGVWDAEGARREGAGRFTWACEAGAIAKCIGWGYKPWQSKDGHLLVDHHQACTRMARADYCGNGRSHTKPGNLIDMYDRAGVQQRATAPVAGWDPAQVAFEAAWTTEGAYCLEHTREGQARKAILAECPDRFVTGVAEDLGEGDRCTVRRKGATAAAILLRNWSEGKGETSVAKR